MEKTKSKPKQEAGSKKPKNITCPLPSLNLKPAPLAILVIMVFIFFFVGTKFNGLVAVAKVGKKPVFAWDVAQSLWQRYRANALNDLVYESLVVQTAQEMGLTVTDEEVTERVNLIVENSGGQEELNNFLAQQGMRYEDYLHNIKISLLGMKIVENQVEIKETEIDALIREYGANLTATDEADQREEARQVLEDQKASELYQTIFEDMSEKVGVSYYVKYAQ
ncbi:SurA N-terminal domain-containing protein [Patescibacteria group bacterium]|nr:SurA N-terminal domain-containing protein [Patescibacteria group bacterium]